MSTATQSAKEKYHALLSSAIKTAGSDNWKVTAGRIDGSESFEFGDAWRIVKLNFKSTSKPKACPVCLETPKSPDDWYITKSCRHAVCKECLQNYASNQISDPNHHGPLLCPCCPRQLRVQDAKVALDRQHTIKPRQHKSIKKIAPKVMMKRLFADEINSESINNSALEHLLQWDTKTRDDYLRSATDFRPWKVRVCVVCYGVFNAKYCPHCSQDKTNDDTGDIDAKDNNTSTRNHMTGGFVTPECLAPINEDRERKAEYLLRLASGGPGSILLVYIIYYMICAGRSTTQPTDDRLSTILQLMMALVPSVLVPIVPHLMRLLLARIARRVIIQPVTVTCPCCEKDFPLLASSELEPISSNNASESATEQWKNSNTRPCPNCASPILKDGGCNHVKCVRCRTEFCWACMKLRSRCQAYKCKNRAPYGNAFGDGSLNAVISGLNALERERQEGQTLMERIDNAEAQALNNLSLIRNPIRSAAAVGTLFIAVSFLNPQSTLWSAISRSLSFVVRMLRRMILLFADSFIYVSIRLICAYVLFEAIAQYTGQRSRPAEGIRGDGTRQNRGRGFNGNIRRRRRIIFRNEEEEIQEAIDRSLVEQ